MQIEFSAVGARSLDELRVRAGYRDDVDVVRLALWHLAQHYDLDVPVDAFVDPARVSGARAAPARAARASSRTPTARRHARV